MRKGWSKFGYLRKLGLMLMDFFENGVPFVI